MDGGHPSTSTVATAPDLQGLAQRFVRARLAALRAVAGHEEDRESGEDSDELALLQRAATLDLREVMRLGFENSLRLGESWRRYHRAAIALSSTFPTLAALGPACFQGTPRVDEEHGAVFLERQGCGRCDPLWCDWWREVSDGLVIGMSGSLRCTRHRSRGHGDDGCVDVVYADPESPLRFGIIPEEMKDGLEAARRAVRRFDASVDVAFLGVSEGVLLYELRRAGCQGDIDSAAALEKNLRKRFPDLALREVSPRAVFDDKGEGDSCG